MENKDLKILKKYYGEDFAKLCRSLFPTILETEGLLSKIILDHFAPTRSLYKDITKSLGTQDDFKTYIFGLVDVEKGEISEIQPKTAEELMDEAGYILYPECQTEEEVQSFKKYWKPNEELCTFRGGRLEYCRVWFAVKKNVDQIRREDFSNPQRQDEYGTSAISIQFSRSTNSTISIKNRYNHTVNNPDATFSNNLDNIIPGLTEAFVHEYEIDLVASARHNFEIPGYVLADDGKYYRSNVETGGVHYCENNVVVLHGDAMKLDKSRYIVVDNHIIDKEFKTIDFQHWQGFELIKDRILKFEDEQKDRVRNITITIKKGQHLNEDEIFAYFTNPSVGTDENGNQVIEFWESLNSFTESIGEIEKIDEAYDEKKNRVILITPKQGQPVKITVNENGEIIGYKNQNVISIGDRFMIDNRALKRFVAPNLKEIGNHFLEKNSDLEELTFESVEKVGEDFLYYNKILKSFIAPNLKEVGEDFLYYNKILKSFIAPKLKQIGHYALYSNQNLEELTLESVEKIDMDFLSRNQILRKFVAPKLKEVHRNFLLTNLCLEELTLESLESCGASFVGANKIMKKFIAPKLFDIGGSFLFSNLEMEELSLESADFIWGEFMGSNEKLKKFYGPKIKAIRSDFLVNNQEMEELTLESVEWVKHSFIPYNKKLKVFIAPNLKETGQEFLMSAKHLQEVVVAEGCETINDVGMSCALEDLPRFKNAVKHLGDEDSIDGDFQE